REHCAQYIQNLMSTMSPCDALVAANEYVCVDIDPVTGEVIGEEPNTPIVTDPEPPYPPEIMDCITELNLLIADYAAAQAEWEEEQFGAMTIYANNDNCCETHAECMMEWERKYACAYYHFITLNDQTPAPYAPEPIEIDGFECEDYFCIGIDCDPDYYENEDPIYFREYLLDHYGDVWNDKYTDCGPGKCFDMHDDDCDGTNVGDDDNDTDTDYGDSCYSEALEYIDTHLLADFSNACEVYDYVIENFDCL